MTDQLPFATKLAHNIGLIVLVSQELERHLKVVVAAIEHSATKSVVQRHQKLERRPLGEVVKRFLENVTVTEGSLTDLESYFKLLLDRRNKVVHHFFETYGKEVEAGKHTDVLADLAALYKELRVVAASFRSVNEAFLESLDEELPLAS